MPPPSPRQQDALATHSAFKAFTSILRESHQRSIGLVQIRLRPLTEEVAYSQGDYDFLLNPGQKLDFLRIVFHHCSIAATPFFIDQRKRDKTIVQLWDPASRRGITLELWTSLEVKDPTKRGVSRIWWEDLYPHIQANSQSQAFSPVFESLYYLSHLHTKHKQFDHPEVQRRLTHYANCMRHKTAIAVIYQRLMADKDISHAAADANMYLMEMGVLRQKKELSSFLNSERETLHNKAYKTRKRWQARGNIIAFVGPDGVGKTTIINAFKQQLSGKVSYFRFKKLFRGALVYKLLLPLLRQLANSHHRTRLAKNQIDDHFGTLLFLIARLRYSTISIRRLWHSILLTDRYFHDFLSHGLRFSDTTTIQRRSSEWLLKLLPQPRCLVQLDADYDTIASRKNELSEEDVGFYRDIVFSTYLRKPSPYYLYLNTTRDLSQCTEVLTITARNIAIRPSDSEALINQEVLDLTGAVILGKGNERTCYADPMHTNRCIKTGTKGNNGREQNRLEHYYLSSLLHRAVPFDYIPRYYGWVATTNGKGLLFERIVGRDGNPAPSLGKVLIDRFVDCDTLRRLLEELYIYLHQNAIVFADISLNNILLGTTPHGEERLYIIDGLGARRYGIKLWLQTNIKWVARNKLNKQWPILLKRIEEHCHSSSSVS
jgi:thymidylate kinase